MRTIIAVAALVIVSTGCTTTKVQFPPPHADGGIHVEVLGLYRSHGRVLGISGIAENQTGRRLRTCMLSFDALDADGVKVADAIASAQGLDPGQKWRFQAVFTAPFRAGFERIGPARITTF